MTRNQNQDPLRNETEIIKRIWRALPTRAGKKRRDWLRLGIGDDAAVIRNVAHGEATAGDWVLSTDSFLEGVHFLPDVHSPGDIGYKALARATSDLAAMGAAPRFFLMSLALPSSRTGKWLDGFLKGMGDAAHELGMALIGGDTSRFSSLAINVTVSGRAGPSQGTGKRALSGETQVGHLLTRSGARPSDLIYVSGTLGAAQLGLEIILHGLDGKANTPRIPSGRHWKGLLQPHLRPKVQLALGRWLAGENPSRGPIASAAIDTSDGLSTDLNHICRSSGVGARIWAERIPAVAVPESLRRHGFTLKSLELALHGGEDYQLLFTVPPVFARRLPLALRGVKLTQIGEIVPLRMKSIHRASRIELVTADGRTRPLIPAGWDPFAKR
ncbi:MAG: thiamine-phosphate kinase [Candidatus Acidiferrales bacterium]